MKTYTILRHPERGYETVKVGFNWPAAIFAFWWTLFKGFWFLALLFLGLWFLAQYVVHEVHDSEKLGWAIAFLGLSLVTRYLIGRYGNSLRLSKLQRRGYVSLGAVAAGSVDDALRAWQDQHPGDFNSANPFRPYKAKHKANPALEYRYTLDELRNAFARGIVGDDWRVREDSQIDWHEISEFLSQSTPQASASQKS